MLAAMFGILGAILLALPTMPEIPARGFAAFVVSNIGWIIVSAWQRAWPLHVMHWVYLACSLVGLWNWS